ncbi:MAG: FAD-dependent hydroxylase [Xenococcaceae cyanobacterium MO_167.B27]|nr:FAD-dependent hydroxylase [Xenococcaceae cyanobacterium MO_167.B27]
MTLNRQIETPTLECDVAIVGGGIVGTTLASALKDSGLKITIIEAQPLEVAAARKQAYAFSILSSRIYQGIGVWDKIFPHVGKFNKIRLSDADFSEIVKFEKEDLETDYLGYVAQHNIVLTALQEHIAHCSNINWLCPGKVSSVIYEDNLATVTVEVAGQQQQIKAKLVIGADGAKSRIRSLANITTRGWKYWQSCVAFTIKHTAPQNDIAFERFWSTGPMGVLPLPGNRCQIVWTNPHPRAKTLKELDKAVFLQELQQYTGGLLGDLELVSDRVIFPVQLMQCDRYVKSRLALVGDAAHCCHPVGGQGLNLGIRDAATLAQLLIEAHNKGEDIGALPVLNRYESWRKQENLAILGFTDFLDRFFSNNWLPVVIVRRLGLWLMANVKPMKMFALKLMTGLKGKTPKIAAIR